MGVIDIPMCNGEALKNAILCSTCAYKYIHFVAHSAGSKLIDDAAKKLAQNWGKLNSSQRPFIQLTFLDAYKDDNNHRDEATYGALPDYPEHYSEHYVDMGLLYTDAKLTNAYNFDITDWPAIRGQRCRRPAGAECFDEKNTFGHQWPRYWYEKSVTAHWYNRADGFRYGYPLSREGGLLMICQEHYPGSTLSTDARKLPV
jgi:hypothetical protein